MATNWVLAQAVANANTTLPTQAKSITAPVAGSLLIVTAYLVVSVGTGPTSFTCTDSSSGAWTPWSTINTATKLSAQRFFKISDGTETSCSITGVGYSGSIATTRITVTNFTVTGGGTIGIDLALSGVSGSVSSISVSPASGSGHSSNADELALIYSANAVGLTHSSASFTGTSALAAATATGLFNGDATIEYYVGGVQAALSPATTNVFKQAYNTGPGITIYDGATFYYTNGPVPITSLWKPRGMSQAVHRATTY